MYDVPPRLHADVRPLRSCPRHPPAMNAPNPLMPESRPLSEATLEQLRRAIQDRRQSPAIGDEPLQTALQVVASEARERALRPEELIVTLKQLMDEPRSAKSSSSEDRQLREWIVTTCIRAYFEGS
jgi:hypothetical protein